MITVEGTIPFPPTEPEAVAAFGTSCASVAQALGAAATQVTTATTAAAGAWQGSASGAFQGHMSTTTTSITQFAQQLARVQPVITTYVGKMTAAETAYNTAVQQQMAAIAAGPSGLADEAVAIGQEVVAVAELQAAGVVCAGSLTEIAAGVSDGAISSLLKQLTAPLTTGEMVEHSGGILADMSEAVEKEAGTLATKAVGDVAADIGALGHAAGSIVTIAETEDRFDELVKQGVPESAAFGEAMFSRVGPTLAGGAVGAATTAAVDGEGAVEGAAVGTVVEPVGGTAVGALVGAAAAAAPAAAAGAAADLATTRVTQIGADSLVEQFNTWAFAIKPEGPKETVPPPTAAGGSE